ncbi:response regulator [Azorhizobium doebereinerae]|uniref:response regulator n=1 Tax=Azorhizobium doebereinerae TaxID=281091 RepID=UPI000419F049|nr:response regulator [Azorhizobium doebereinerae]
MKTCLVVDDSGVVRKVARRILEDLSFSVREAADGQAALQSCEELMPDGILLDWNMPVMEGIEFLQVLRQREGGDVPRVIFCTTNNDIEHITRAIEAGANEYIMKPFDQDILREKLEEVGLLEKAPAT